MSKFSEYIIAGFFVTLGFLVVHNARAEESVIKCYPNTEFMKLIDDKALVTLYNGLIGTKMHEVMMTKDRHMYIVEYDKASDGNALQAKQYCVTGILSDVTFNDSAIEFLSNLLDKYKGQKT
jgi:hypothetical protein